MAHIEQIDFCNRVKQMFPDYFTNCSVLDVGSMDINGNNRYLFDNYSYIGVDLGEGKNVDIIEPLGAHVLDFQEQFDVVISTECLEHDKYYPYTLKKMIKWTKGLMIFTCATTGRQEHGTTRTSANSSPFTNDYYKNLTQRDIERHIYFPNHFKRYGFEVHNVNHDLYFWGIK